MQPKRRVLIADDHAGMREEVCSLLTPAFDVVGVVGDGVALVAAAAELRPDLILADIRMPRCTGIEASREIIRAGLCSVIVILSMFRDPELVESAFQAGASGYVLKMDAAEELMPALWDALNGRRYVSRGLAIA